MERIGRAIVVVAAILPLASCGRSDSFGFTPVTGRVTFDGQPLERGEIRFSPDSAAGTNGPQSMSPLGPGGEFVLRGPGGRVGAVPGQHRVYLAMPEDGPPTPPSGAEATGVAAGVAAGGADAAPQAGLGMKKVPRRYLAAETAGLAATITPGEAARFDFEIVSTPPTK